MADAQMITIRYVNGEEQQVAVDREEPYRLYPAEDRVIIHFGRDDGSGWYELVAAPLASVRSWG